MTDYSHILQAVQSPPKTEDRKLTTAQELDNYAAFSELMKKGVYLPDLIKRIDDPPKQETEIIDEDILEVMESAVSEDQEVKDAYVRVVDAKNAVLRKLCLSDPEFWKAHEEYQRVVRRKYVELKK